ncbi:hypothetical protein Bealeia1_00561 [Candidatus Bealeia paramacronuclearis]|uniref:Uncharacterized protein n=1 Tax=Candidatus Bealeia paramacronuclearis TaxID=1921001 RepID=A0ABZ2C1P2_9PROT|nr:hypothetical protein [Candidatus Bealeia paramacronuclearis]
MNKFIFSMFISFSIFFNNSVQCSKEDKDEFENSVRIIKEKSDKYKNNDFKHNEDYNLIKLSYIFNLLDEKFNFCLGLVRWEKLEEGWGNSYINTLFYEYVRNIYLIKALEVIKKSEFQSDIDDVLTATSVFTNILDRYKFLLHDFLEIRETGEYELVNGGGQESATHNNKRNKNNLIPVFRVSLNFYPEHYEIRRKAISLLKKNEYSIYMLNFWLKSEKDEDINLRIKKIIKERETRVEYLNKNFIKSKADLSFDKIRMIREFDLFKKNLNIDLPLRLPLLTQLYDDDMRVFQKIEKIILKNVLSALELPMEEEKNVSHSKAICKTDHKKSKNSNKNKKKKTSNTSKILTSTQDEKKSSDETVESVMMEKRFGEITFSDVKKEQTHPLDENINPVKNESKSLENELSNQIFKFDSNVNNDEEESDPIKDINNWLQQIIDQAANVNGAEMFTISSKSKNLMRVLKKSPNLLEQIQDATSKLAVQLSLKKNTSTLVKQLLIPERYINGYEYFMETEMTFIKNIRFSKVTPLLTGLGIKIDRSRKGSRIHLSFKTSNKNIETSLHLHDPYDGEVDGGRISSLRKFLLDCGFVMELKSN